MALLVSTLAWPFSWDNANFILDRKNPRSRLCLRSNPTVPFEAEIDISISIDMLAFRFVTIGPLWLRYSKFQIWPWSPNPEIQFDVENSRSMVKVKYTQLWTIHPKIWQMECSIGENPPKFHQAESMNMRIYLISVIDIAWAVLTLSCSQSKTRPASIDWWS